MAFAFSSEAETGELALELGQTAAAVEQRLLPARPGRMRGGIDVEVHRVAFLAPGRLREILGAVGHHHLDRVVVGVDVLSHRSRPDPGGIRAASAPAAILPV